MISAVARLLLCAVFLLGAGANAQEKKPSSPRDSVMIELDTNIVSVNYGRPSMRGRAIMGGLVPWNAVWRTGANQATHLKTNFDMTLGSVPVMRGTYTLWTIPTPTEWTIIINKQTGQWGTKYNDGLDLARFTVPAQSLDNDVEQFTVGMKKTGPVAGEISLEWEKTRVVIPFHKNDAIRPLSPTDSAVATIGSGTVKIIYSQPHRRGRSIWGVVVPYDSVWRTGANNATRLETDQDIMIAGTRIPGGTYTVYSIPGKDRLQLIISKKAAGAANYDPTMDLARIPMTASPAVNEIDPFTISFVGGNSATTTLQLGWADMVYTAPVSLP